MKYEVEIPDCIFPTDNELEIPTLDLSMQAETCEIPFVLYGEQARTFQMGGQGTLHFYTDDYRYGDIYQHPSKILNHHPHNIVEPNFSLFSETPIAFGLQSVYKKRFIARALQDRGIRVFVDLNVNSKFYKLNMIGVPQGWRAFCTRGYSDRVNYLAYEYEIAKMWSGDRQPLFVVYGGGEVCKQFCRENGCIYISNMVSLKKKIAKIEGISDTVAFFGTSIQLPLPETPESIRESQVLNYSEQKSLEV